jgi:hypothetical protein
MNLKGNSKVKSHESRGGLSGSSPLRSDDPCDSQVGMLYYVSGSQKTLKVKLNIKGDYQARVHSDQKVLVMAR